MNAKQRQRIPVICADLPKQPDADQPRAESAFSAGHSDGFADATNGHPKDPAARFARWHRKRPVSDFADYERAYLRSYRDAERFMRTVAS